MVRDYYHGRFHRGLLVYGLGGVFEMSLSSPLSRVLGSGSAKEGTDHWWMQRVTAVGLLILGLWFLISIAALDSFAHDDMHAWVREPINALMLLLSGVTIARHSVLGVQVVIEDYVRGPALKVVSIILNKFVHLFLGAAAVFAVLKVALGAPL